MLRPCLDCKRLTPDSRCPDHRRANERARGRARAGTIEKLVYSSSAYKRARAAVMAGATHCAWCGATGVRLVAGHRFPIAERPDLATSTDGLAPSCVSCNELSKRRKRP